jgi:hypothetical protein
VDVPQAFGGGEDPPLTGRPLQRAQDPVEAPGAQAAAYKPDLRALQGAERPASGFEEVDLESRGSARARSAGSLAGGVDGARS